MQTQEVAWFDSAEEAEEAVRRLAAAGVTASIAETGGKFEVQVPEEYAYVSIQLIADGDRESGVAEGGAPMPCPECGSFETRDLPPYAFLSFVVLVGLFVLLNVLRYEAIAFAVIVVGWPLLLWLGRFSGRKRCARCRWLFSEESGGRR